MNQLGACKNFNSGHAFKGKSDKADACGTGTLKTLETLVKYKGYEYDCFDVYADASDKKQTKDIARCVAGVIKAIQTGRFESYVRMQYGTQLARIFQ